MLGQFYKEINSSSFFPNNLAASHLFISEQLGDILSLAATDEGQRKKKKTGKIEKEWERNEWMNSDECRKKCIF